MTAHGSEKCGISMHSRGCAGSVRGREWLVLHLAVTVNIQKLERMHGLAGWHEVLQVSFDDVIPATQHNGSSFTRD